MILRNVLFVLCLISCVVRAEEDTTITLDRAIAKAMAGNPGLAEIKARAEALATIPPQAGALPDPTLNLDLLNLPVRSFDPRQEDMTMVELGVSQSIPFPGKRALKQKAAEQDAMAAAKSVEEARLRLTRDVKSAWWSLFYVDRALQTTEDAEQFFQQLIDAAQTRYRVGQGAQADVMMAQLELSKLKDERLELIGMRHVQTAQFNVLLDSGPESAVSLPTEAPIQLPQLTEAQLQEKALFHSPRFAQHLNMLDAAKTRVDLAKKDLYPDFTLGAGYGLRQNTPSGATRSDFASFRFSMNLPIYADRKQAKAVDQRRSELLQEQYSLQDDHHRVQAEIASKLAQYEHGKERLALFEHEIMPQARQTVESLMVSYPIGKTTFSDLLRAELSLFQYQTQYWLSLTRTQQLLADLTALIGEEVAHD